MSFKGHCTACGEKKRVRGCEKCGKTYCRDCAKTSVFSSPKCPSCGGVLRP
ncbi:hypothetical protein K8R32_01140 [bacterium]|nr:hypothetical protein [bacterium]